MKDFVRRLGVYRKKNADILATGEAKIEKITNSILIMERKSETGRIRLCVNRTDKAQNTYFDMQSSKLIFQENNSSINKVEPYGITIIRE